MAQRTYNNPGTPATFTVPANVTSILVELAGGAGGFSGDYRVDSPGAGGLIRGTLAVTPGEVLTIYVGDAGGDLGDGAVSGGVQSGGDGYFSAGGGGGATRIERAGGALLAIAGGGGGAGKRGSGDDINPPYESSSHGGNAGSDGASALPFSTGGGPWDGAGGGGEGPTATLPGTGGRAGTGGPLTAPATPGTAGVSLVGGNGGAGANNGGSGGGGGGGGGFYGGGGGGGGGEDSRGIRGGGGGAGGSSRNISLTDYVVVGTNAEYAEGYALFTYFASHTLSLASSIGTLGFPALTSFVRKHISTRRFGSTSFSSRIEAAFSKIISGIISSTALRSGSILRTIGRSLTGSATPNSGVTKRTSTRMDGGLSFSSETLRTLFFRVAGTLSASAANISIIPGKVLGGSVDYLSRVQRSGSRAFASTVSFVGDIAKNPSKVFTSVLDGTSAFASLLIKNLGGAIAPSATKVKEVRRLITAEILALGNLGYNALGLLFLSSTLTSAGEVIKSSARSFAGALTQASALVRTPGITLTGDGTLGGSLHRLSARVLNGTLTASSVVARAFVMLLAGALNTVGTPFTAATIRKALASSVSATSEVIRSFAYNRFVGGVLHFVARIKEFPETYPVEACADVEDAAITAVALATSKQGNAAVTDAATAKLSLGEVVTKLKVTDATASGMAVADEGCHD